MEKVCKQCNKNFSISAPEQEMYKKHGLIIPDYCFLCRTHRYLAVWNFGKFRKTTSDLSGKSIITSLSPMHEYPIFSRDEWSSDEWDPLDYGIEYDPSKSFFDQFKELQNKVPRPHQYGARNQDCDWSDDVWNSKNCYLARSIEGGEDLMYVYRIWKCKNSASSAFCFESENLYECNNCTKCYNTMYSENSQTCIDSYFLYDCKNCSNCFGCYNLRNKQYCIWNKQYSKEEYFATLQQLDLGSRTQIQELKEKFGSLIANEAIHKAVFNINAPGCTGNYLVNCENVQNGFMFSDTKDGYNIVRGLKLKDSVDIVGCWMAEKFGNVSCCTESYDLQHCSWCDNSRYSQYCDMCFDVENCFGCIGLKKKQYCILNKQYSKEEYNTLRQQIRGNMKERGEYGQYFPYNAMSEPINMTSTMLYFPETTKEDAVSLGAQWYDVEDIDAEGLLSNELPDNIQDVDSAICTKQIVCSKTGWKYNIAPAELSFYKKYTIPLPDAHFDERIKELIQRITVITPYQYTCFVCGDSVTSYYPKQWGYKKIACESCYQKEVI